MEHARSLISLADLSDGDLHWLVERSVAFATGAAAIERRLDGRLVAVYFRKTSTRTRTAFSAAALRLGAQLLTFGPDDLQIGTGETYADTGRVLASMVDGLVARTADDPKQLRDLAAQGRMAVINAMTADEHPTQAIADLATMRQHAGAVEGVRVLYLGEGNNSAAALALALTRYKGTSLHLRTPAGYGLAAGTLARARTQADRQGSHIDERHDTDELPTEVDVVYTTQWQTTGTTKPDPDWRSAFAPFQVDEQLMARWPAARFMHDLPAHRGEEVTAGVLDGPCSLAFDQAANKYHSALAVLEWSLARGGACEGSDAG